jgi:L-cystine uptake protein TcyP (sodium:dicarboxylate symporter family)
MQIRNNAFLHSIGPSPILKKHSRKSGRPREITVSGDVAAGCKCGLVCHTLASTPEMAKNISGYFSIITDAFLGMIKLIIAPLRQNLVGPKS